MGGYILKESIKLDIHGGHALGEICNWNYLNPQGLAAIVDLRYSGF